MAETTTQRIHAIVADHFFLDAADVTAETLLPADSLDRVSLGMRLAEEFEIEVAAPDARALKTVGDVVALVRRAQAS